MPRVLIVSNRLPVTAKVNGRDVTIEPSSGGLASGLRGTYEQVESLWIGWPGEIPRLDDARERILKAKLAEIRAVPVHLSRQEVRGFYEETSNGVIWPLFHYLLDELPPMMGRWDMYRLVNEKYARVVAEHYRPGDLVWIHDYQLLMVPSILRRLAGNDVRIGFFLHVPFPSSEVFSVLPQREEVLEGLLGADLIGFHTASYMRHFMTSVRRVLGYEPNVDRISIDGREVRAGVYPMGIDAAAWSARADSPEVTAQVETIRNDAQGRKLLVGIDRLDYTKGIPRRLLALERLLETEPSLREQVRMIQVTVPSRERVESYAAFRRRIDELVGRINSTYATATWVPIHNINRSMSEVEVTALYRAADVMLVTPLRDGMNLVAKEFVASRNDKDGVLVLSEFAGAAAELGEGLQVNPYDVDQMARRIKEGLTMPRSERRSRMRAMRLRVMTHDVHGWATKFISDLTSATTRAVQDQRAPTEIELDDIVRGLGEARHLVLILDYDGTLVPFAPRPEQAAPGPELLALLERIATRAGTSTHVVSGRSRASLEEWLGYLPMGLHAEHGLWSRWTPEEDWIKLRELSLEWKEKVRPLMEHFVSTTRGTFIEEKTASLAWHYRTAEADFIEEADFGEYQARELRLLLGELLSNAPVEVLAGHKVVEVRPQGVHKGAIVPLMLARYGKKVTVLAIGDDRTDEDLFAALPDGSVALHVGEGPSRAQYRVRDVDDVRRLLEMLLE